MGKLELFLMGTPVIKVDGIEKAYRRQQNASMALLAYLVVEQSDVASESVLTHLWPDGNLSTLAKLRSRMQKEIPELLIQSSNSKKYTLAGNDDLWCDFTEYLRLVNTCLTCNHFLPQNCQYCAARWEKVIALCQREFLQGIYRRGNPDFDTWTNKQRHKIERDLVLAYEHLIEYYLSEKDFDLAWHLADEWFHRDWQHEPLSQQAYAYYIKMLISRGQPDQAIEYYEALQANYPILITKDFEGLIDDGLEIADVAKRARKLVVSSARIRVYRSVEQIEETSAQFFGRENEIQTALDYLSEGRRVVIHGLAGIGKTTVAQHIVSEHLKAEKQNIIWLNWELDTQAIHLLHELATLFDRNDLLTEPLAAIQSTLKNILNDRKITIVLDNVWHQPELEKFMAAVPANKPVIITSRIRLFLKNRVFVDLNPLEPDASIRLLEFYAVRNYQHDADAHTLCRILGGHPYSLEIAGLLLADQDMHSIGRLAEEITGAASITNRRTPVNMVLSSFSNLVARTIEYLREFSEHAYALFRLIKSLSTNRATLTLLEAILDEHPDVIHEWLRQLQNLGLMKYYDDVSVPYYQMHNLTFIYIDPGGQVVDAEIIDCIQRGIVKFTQMFATDSNLLSIEIENILGVVTKTEDIDILIPVVEILMVKGYFYTRGMKQTPALLGCTERAIEAARAASPDYDESLSQLLTKRGDIAKTNNQLNHAYSYYQQALDYIPEADVHQQIIVLSLIATVLHQQQGPDAQVYFQRARKLAEITHDLSALARVTEYEGACASRRKDFQTAITLLKKAVSLAESAQDDRRIFWSMYNLSMTQLHLQAGFEDDVYEQLLRVKHIADHHDNNYWRGAVFSGLARVYHARSQHDDAQRNLDDALTLYRDYGALAQVEWVRTFCEKEGYDFLAPDQFGG